MLLQGLELARGPLLLALSCLEVADFARQALGLGAAGERHHGAVMEVVVPDSIQAVPAGIADHYAGFHVVENRGQLVALQARIA